ncbi:MAG: nicotinate (nicotinamide) nucleotide adenylyltransferase [Phycisphaerae bacterium]|nr:nicotinate (nicotinamide) nucleotide adenylyltransferase [Phycisphaerae bacterium]NNF43754.1 nicotinate (nicotinamide) nucleotide adenylyltransferase [Phycisphaerales bacterium]
MTEPASPDRPRVLLFGGTFDPPHRAHVELALMARDALGCSRVIFVPAATSPFKTDTAPTDDRHRLAMLQAAIADVPDAEIATIEIDRGGVSYFVETLEATQASLGPNADIRFLIGADQALSFHRWHDWPRILEIATPAVLLRPPWDHAAFAAALGERLPPEKVQVWLDRVVETPLRDVSATEARRRLRTGEPVDDLLPPAVAAYIAKHRLYRE